MGREPGIGREPMEATMVSPPRPACEFCGRPAQEYRPGRFRQHCRAHYERMRKGATAVELAAPVQTYESPRDRVMAAMLAVVDCDDEDHAAYRNAWERFRNAVKAWVKSE